VKYVYSDDSDSNPDSEESASNASGMLAISSMLYKCQRLLTLSFTLMDLCLFAFPINTPTPAAVAAE
jgi:hypothetical protein